MNGWFDSHCHVQEEYLGGGEGGKADRDLSAVLERAEAAGVGRLVCIGTGPVTSAQVRDPTTDRLVCHDMTDNSERPDRRQPTDRNEPTEATEPADPTLPIESTEPMEPMDSMELRDPMDSTEF